MGIKPQTTFWAVCNGCGLQVSWDDQIGELAPDLEGFVPNWYVDTENDLAACETCLRKALEGICSK